MKHCRLKNGEMVVIREALVQDAVDILDFIEQISTESEFLTFGAGEFGISLAQEEIFIENILNSENQLMICAFLSDELVGQLNFAGGSRPRTRHTGEFGVSVLKAHWGKGIAKELIKYLLTWAKLNNIRKVNLRVRSDHKAAIGLYKGLGFKYGGIITRDFFINDVFYDSIQMGMEIDCGINVLGVELCQS